MTNGMEAILKFCDHISIMKGGMTCTGFFMSLFIPPLQEIKFCSTFF